MPWHGELARANAMNRKFKILNPGQKILIRTLLEALPAVAPDQETRKRSIKVKGVTHR
jgi:hypothetical protein